MYEYINILKKLNRKALKNNDVPVSCIILCKNKIISRGYNMRELKNNPIYHAEVIAIQKAAKKLKRWNLSDCSLIVTLEPCKMCLEIMKMAKISKIYYILKNEKNVNNKLELSKIDTPEETYFSNEIKNFFIDKR